VLNFRSENEKNEIWTQEYFPLYGSLIGLGWPAVCGMRLKNKIHSFIFYCGHTHEYEGIALPLLRMRARGNDRLDHSCWISVSSDLSNLTHIAVQVSPLKHTQPNS